MPIKPNCFNPKKQPIVEPQMFPKKNFIFEILKFVLLLKKGIESLEQNQIFKPQYL